MPFLGHRTFEHAAMILRSLPGIVAAALTLLAALAVGTFAALGEPKWSTYRSPSGLYSVDHPSGWKVERDENIVNIIADDGSGAVTISAYIGKPPASLEAEQLISVAFPTQQPTSPLRTITGPGWKGTRRTFLDKSKAPHREWEIIVATNADGMVIITSNEASPMTAARARVYTRIMRSLRLSTPQRP
jgi:hypothetical protein